MHSIPVDKELVFPHSKINIGLNVIERLPGGYHRLQSLLYPIPWCDALEIVPEGDIHHCRLTIDGRDVSAEDQEDNLVVKAYRLMASRFPELPGVAIHLDKNIPIGAGMGGGSSDAAHVLISLRRMFDLGLSDTELERGAAHLGADCPFFCRQGPQYLDGIGPELTPMAVSLLGFYIVVVMPTITVSTAEAFRGVVVEQPEFPLNAMLKLPPELWVGNIDNAFERTIFKIYPQLRDDKATLYVHGAYFASMTGSGSALYAIYRERPSDYMSWFPRGYRVYCFKAEY